MVYKYKSNTVRQCEEEPNIFNDCKDMKSLYNTYRDFVVRFGTSFNINDQYNKRKDYLLWLKDSAIMSKLR